MEYLTITEEAKYAVGAICNETLVTEYDFILSYPRIIDNMVNNNKITDKQLLDDIETLGKDSLTHFGIVDNMVQRLGAKTAWSFNTLPRSVDIIDVLESQYEKEKSAHYLYNEARKVANANKTTIKTGGIFNMFRLREIQESEIIPLDFIISRLDRLITDENRHMRIVVDSLATFKSLLRK